MSYGLPANSQGSGPECYRHVGRETWIQCTRCLLPICPECMTPAAVGYQCPNCVAAGRKLVGRRRNGSLGGPRWDSTVTNILILTCCMSFLVVGLGGAFGGNAAWGMQPLGIAFAGQWWRLFSAIFMHAGVLHLGFNMYMLFMLGTPLERLLGRGHFLILFLLSGLGGSVASYVFSDIGTLSVGASGAVFGLMSASIVFSRRLHSEANQLLGLLIANVALGFLLPGIDWRAHLGGAAAGATVGWVLSTGGTTATVRTSRRQTMGLCVFVLLQFAIVLWRSQQLQSL